MNYLVTVLFYAAVSLIVGIVVAKLVAGAEKPKNDSDWSLH
jgi:uncharacterized membrane-anchored protein YhcB (DUF1043 family)